MCCGVAAVAVGTADAVGAVSVVAVVATVMVAVVAVFIQAAEAQVKGSSLGGPYIWFGEETFPFVSDLSKC